MPMSKTTMAKLRIAELVKAYPDIPMTGDIYNEMLKYYEADSEGIIKDIQTNATTVPSGEKIT